MPKRIGRLALPLVFSCLALASAVRATDAFVANQMLAPGINYGNVLEADPPEGWGAKVDEKDFKAVAAAGFKSIRIPVRWSARSDKKAPYTIDPAFFALVDRAVNAALGSGLRVVLNIHHFDELFKDPYANKERFLGMWEQIAPHYSKYPATLYLEILNEPHDKLTAPIWNRMQKEALAVIRKSNPERMVIIEGADWGGASGLKDMYPPSGDKNLICSFHHYDPFHFTHQGAEWVGPESKAWLGTKWSGTPAEVAALEEGFKKADQFSKRYKLPIYVGEFGAYKTGDPASRRTWAAANVTLCKKYGYSYAYWELKSGFGIYDPKTGKWDEGIRDALLGK
jgi:endoglucanase